ncbi:MAG TPA: DEAD/DEAH box helicase family protein [Solirubrobacteraceae bacterium]|nr:DEAD/DEAH box helicase family protein [Solirubrobacteraceae bacterium]
MPKGDRAPFPTAAAIARAEKLTRETFVHPGESREEALAPGTPRRRALDAAIAEIDQGLTIASLEWRREFSLLLGLERVLSDDEPRLADGTLLNPHQVDALSGTLTALLAQTAAAAAAEAATVGSPPPTLAPAHAPELSADAPRLAAGAADPDDLDEDEDEDEDDLDDEPEDEEPRDFPEDDAGLDSDVVVDLDDPGADRRFWFEHATGAGKTVAAMGFVEASRTGGVLILTHRRNLVDQFIDEIRTRGYRDRLCAPLLIGQDAANGPVTVETYQWFVRNAGKISDAYTVVICDEAHTALGEKTSAQIRSWDKPVWIGMTATGALIARHVTDLFPTQTSRFDLAQAARRGVIAPLRCIRIPPGPGVRTIAKVPLRRGEVDTEFDQEMLAELLDQTPFNLAIADLYKTRFNGLPGVVYAAGVKHAYNVAESFRALNMNAQAVSGETPKRELARILADYEAGKVDVLINAQLLAEGWNSPRATVCMHLAPTASKRIYQQRVGRVTRRHPGKEAGIVVDFVHPATKHDDPVVTLHSLLDRDVYRGGAIVVGPVRRGRGRRVRVERRVLPVTPDPERRAEVFERELWRIAVEHLDYGEQRVWAQLAGARVQPNGWRRAKAMLHFDREGELRRLFLVTTLQRNRSAQLRLRALQEISAIRDAEAFDTAIDLMGTWPKDERREGVKIMLQALAERRIGRRDQANAWIWRMAEYTREVHEEYAAQRWPETKRLLGLLVNSSGSAHARNARRLVHATRTQDRRLSAALLAAALAHTPEAEEALRGARTRMARKPAALARELLRNFPKAKKSAKRRRKTKAAGETAVAVAAAVGASETTSVVDTDLDLDLDLDLDEDDDELTGPMLSFDDDDDDDDDDPVAPFHFDDDDDDDDEGDVAATDPGTRAGRAPASTSARASDDGDGTGAGAGTELTSAEARAGGRGSGEPASSERPTSRRRSRTRRSRTSAATRADRASVSAGAGAGTAAAHTSAPANADAQTREPAGANADAQTPEAPGAHAAAQTPEAPGADAAAPPTRTRSTRRRARTAAAPPTPDEPAAADATPRGAEAVSTSSATTATPEAPAHADASAGASASSDATPTGATRSRSRRAAATSTGATSTDTKPASTQPASARPAPVDPADIKLAAGKLTAGKAAAGKAAAGKAAAGKAAAGKAAAGTAAAGTAAAGTAAAGKAAVTETTTKRTTARRSTAKTADAVTAAASHAAAIESGQPGGASGRSTTSSTSEPERLEPTAARRTRPRRATVKDPSLGSPDASTPKPTSASDAATESSASGRSSGAAPKSSAAASGTPTPARRPRTRRGKAEDTTVVDQSTPAPAVPASDTGADTDRDAA